MKNRKVFVINPSQSRRLIAKGVIALPQIRYALEQGKIFIGRGSTNAYILEELFNEIDEKEEFNKGDYVAGQIIPGKNFMNWWVNKGNRKTEVLINHGKKEELENVPKALEKFKQGDIFIKGANALDIKGVPAVLVGGVGGGTIGSSFGILISKGIEVICPIGLEKTIFADSQDLQPLMGIDNMDKPAEGMPCGYVPMPFATPITEIEALEILFECEAYHVASGGVGGAEGSVSILVDAIDDDEMDTISEFMEKIAQEPKYIPNLD